MKNPISLLAPSLFLTSSAQAFTQPTGFNLDSNQRPNNIASRTLTTSTLTRMSVLKNPESEHLNCESSDDMREYKLLKAYCDQLNDLQSSVGADTPSDVSGGFGTNAAERQTGHIYSLEGSVISKPEQISSPSQPIQPGSSDDPKAYEIYSIRVEGHKAQENYLLIARPGANLQQLKDKLKLAFGAISEDLDLHTLKRQLELEEHPEQTQELALTDKQVVEYQIVRMDDFMRQLREKALEDVFNTRVLSSLISHWAASPPPQAPETPQTPLPHGPSPQDELPAQRSLPPLFDLLMTQTQSKLLKGQYTGIAFNQAGFDQIKQSILTEIHWLCDRYWGLTGESEADRKHEKDPHVPDKVHIVIKTLMIDLDNHQNEPNQE